MRITFFDLGSTRDGSTTTNTKETAPMDDVFNVHYATLSIAYPELKCFLHGDKFEFSHEGQCALTKALLSHFFDIDITLLPGHLVPAVPSRLMYLKIMHRILEESRCLTTATHVKGLDVGCGAYAIYAMLANKVYHWQMIGVDIDTESVTHAHSVIESNDMTIDLSVEVCDGIPQYEKTFLFMVCNPPFYSSEEEMHGRNLDKKEPLKRQSVVGTASELVFQDGGEVGFVRKLIDQSHPDKGVCVWFSSLLGLKSSIMELIAHLVSVKCENFHVQEYQLGQTKRWILFWSWKGYRPQIVNSTWTNVKVTVFERTFDLEQVKTVLSSLPVVFDHIDDELKITVPGIVWSRQYRRAPQRMVKSQHIFIITPSQIHFHYGKDFKTFQSFYNYLKSKV